MKTPEQAKAAGFTIDTTCYPNVAYKGPRFQPDEWEQVLTEREAKLLETVEALLGTWHEYRRLDDASVRAAESAIAKAHKLNPIPERTNADPEVGQTVIWRGANGKYYTAEVLRVIGVGTYAVRDLVDGKEYGIYDERIIGKGGRP